MSVKILEPHQYSEWNTFVDQSPQGDIFCYTWWLEAITKSDFRILALLEKDEIVAGIPIALDSQKKVNEPPLTRTLGVLYRNKNDRADRKQKALERKWLLELLKYFPTDDFVQMCMHHNFTDWLPFRWNGFSQTTRYTYLINYENRTNEDLWKNLDQLRKRMINRALENKIRVGKSDDIDLLYRYVSLSYERQGLIFKMPYNDLKILDEAINARGNRVIFKASDITDRVHAVLYVVFNEKSAYYLLSGSDPDLRNLGGHTLVMWEALKYFTGKTDVFNFGGSDIESIEEHVRGFGGTLTPYFHIYNERLMWKRTDAGYHLGEAKFHLKELWKIMKNRALKTIRKYLKR